MPSTHLRSAAFLVAVSLSCVGCGSLNGVSVIKQNGELTVRIERTPVTEGSGDTAEETRSVDSFGAVHAMHGFEVMLDPARETELLVGADDNLLALVETVVVDGELRIQASGSLHTKNPITVSVPAAGVTRLQASSRASLAADEHFTDDGLDASANSSGLVEVGRFGGSSLRLAASSSGRVHVQEAIVADIDLKASSSGRVTLDRLVGERVEARASSSGRVQVSAGEATDQTVGASSSGRYEAAGLTSQTAQVNCSSSGRAEVNAQTVTGSASSSGRVHCHGAPTKVEVSTSSSGKVIREG